MGGIQQFHAIDLAVNPQGNRPKGGPVVDDTLAGGTIIGGGTGGLATDQTGIVAGGNASGYGLGAAGLDLANLSGADKATVADFINRVSSGDSQVLGAIGALSDTDRTALNNFVSGISGADLDTLRNAGGATGIGTGGTGGVRTTGATTAANTPYAGSRAPVDLSDPTSYSRGGTGSGGSGVGGTGTYTSGTRAPVDLSASAASAPAPAKEIHLFSDAERDAMKANDAKAGLTSPPGSPGKAGGGDDDDGGKGGGILGGIVDAVAGGIGDAVGDFVGDLF